MDELLQHTATLFPPSLTDSTHTHTHTHTHTACTQMCVTHTHTHTHTHTMHKQKHACTHTDTQGTHTHHPHICTVEPSTLSDTTEAHHMHALCARTRARTCVNMVGAWVQRPTMQ